MQFVTIYTVRGSWEWVSSHSVGMRVRVMRVSFYGNIWANLQIRGNESECESAGIRGTLESVYSLVYSLVYTLSRVHSLVSLVYALCHILFRIHYVRKCVLSRVSILSYTLHSRIHSLSYTLSRLSRIHSLSLTLSYTLPSRVCTLSRVLSRLSSITSLSYTLSLVYSLAHCHSLIYSFVYTTLESVYSKRVSILSYALHSRTHSLSYTLSLVYTLSRIHSLSYTLSLAHFLSWLAHSHSLSSLSYTFSYALWGRVLGLGEITWWIVMKKKLRGQGDTHTATHCNTLQHTATRWGSNGLKGDTARAFAHLRVLVCNRGLQHTATHCNTLQHTGAQMGSVLEPNIISHTKTYFAYKNAERMSLLSQLLGGYDE